MHRLILEESPSAVRQITGECWEEIGIFARELGKNNPGFRPDNQQTKLMKILPAAQFLLAHTHASFDSPINNMEPDEYPDEVSNILSSTPSWEKEINVCITSVDTVLLDKKLFLALFALNPKLTDEKRTGRVGIKKLTSYSITQRDPLVTIGEITHSSSPELIKADANTRIKEHGIKRIELLAGEVIINIH